MITSPKIEQLAFEGKCTWTMFWTGYTSTSTIPCPNGGFILLRSIHWNPFYNGTTRALQLQNTSHQLSLVEQGSKSELIYLFRDPLNEITTGNQGTLVQHNIPCTGPTIIETWATFKQNINVDLMNIPIVVNANYGANTPFLATAQERSLPLGYGATALLPYYTIAAGETYYPTGQKRIFAGTTFSGAGIRDTLRYDFSSARQVTKATAGDLDIQYQFPLVGFGMWVFNIPISEYLNS